MLLPARFSRLRAHLLAHLRMCYSHLLAHSAPGALALARNVANVRTILLGRFLLLRAHLLARLRKCCPHMLAPAALRARTFSLISPQKRSR